MRVLTKPSTAKCSLEHYTAFLLAEAQSAGCVRLSGVSGGEFAHEAANRFLHREKFNAKDLFEEAYSLLALEGGISSVDDAILDKPSKASAWSRSSTPMTGACVPVNYRVVDKAAGKTENELFREMVEEVLGWGLAPAMVTADGWYSGVENLKFLRKKELGFLIALEKTASSANKLMITWRWKAWNRPRAARSFTCGSSAL